MAEATVKKLPAHKDPSKQFKPGQSGNPKGRPKGSRNKLGEAFVTDLLSDWEKNGIAAIEVVRSEKPDAYLKVIASLLPRHVDVKVSPLEEMSDDQLKQRILNVAGELGPLAALLTGGNAGGDGEAEARKPLN